MLKALLARVFTARTSSPPSHFRWTLQGKARLLQFVEAGHSTSTVFRPFWSGMACVERLAATLTSISTDTHELQPAKDSRSKRALAPHLASRPIGESFVCLMCCAERELAIPRPWQCVRIQLPAILTKTWSL